MYNCENISMRSHCLTGLQSNRLGTITHLFEERLVIDHSRYCVRKFQGGHNTQGFTAENCDLVTKQRSVSYQYLFQC